MTLYKLIVANWILLKGIDQHSLITMNTKSKYLGVEDIISNYVALILKDNGSRNSLSWYYLNLLVAWFNNEFRDLLKQSIISQNTTEIYSIL